VTLTAVPYIRSGDASSYPEERANLINGSKTDFEQVGGLFHGRANEAVGLSPTTSAFFQRFRASTDTLRESALSVLTKKHRAS
jgi:hypothetical protein